MQIEDLNHNDTVLEQFAKKVTDKIVAVMALPKNYFNEVEAAIYLCKSETTLRTWRCRGKGPVYIKDGKSVSYEKKDLDAYMQSRKIKVYGQSHA